MKNRILCFALALCMLIPLCGCGEKLDEKVIGVWEAYYTDDSSGYTHSGDAMLSTLTIYKGGTGEYTVYNLTIDEQHTRCNIKWEIVDGVLIITYSGFGESSVGYEYDDKSDTLSSQDASKVYKRTE